MRRYLGLLGVCGTVSCLASCGGTTINETNIIELGDAWPQPGPVIGTVGPEAGGAVEAGVEAGPDAGAPVDAAPGIDAPPGTDATGPDEGPPDAGAGLDAAPEAGIDATLPEAGVDSSLPEAGVDATVSEAGLDAAPEASPEAGPEASIEASVDAPADSSPEAGPTVHPCLAPYTQTRGGGGSMYPIALNGPFAIAEPIASPSVIYFSAGDTIGKDYAGFTLNPVKYYTDTSTTGAVAADQTRVYWGDSAGVVQELDYFSASPVTLGNAVGGPGDIQVYGGTVYWSDTSAGSIKAAPIGGTGATIASGLQAPTLLAVDGTGVYWMTVNSIQRLPAGSTIPVTLATGQAIGGLTLDSTYLYFTDKTANTLSRVPKTGGSGPTLLASFQWGAMAVVVDSVNIYWSNTTAVSPNICHTPTCYNEGLYCMPVAGGSPVQMFSGASPARLAQDSSNIYTPGLFNKP